jgi:multicomponent Na+:H+ antiporter subunit E
VRRILLVLFSFAVWLLLTWTFHWQHLLIGGLVAVITGFAFGFLFKEDSLKILHIQRWFWFIIYVPVFVWEMAKANIDVALHVILGNLRPIKPGIVKVRTRLKSEMGKVFLANSITLTPGTLTVDLKDEYLYIHWIYVRHKDIEKATQAIVNRFELFLIKIFD